MVRGGLEWLESREICGGWAERTECLGGSWWVICEVGWGKYMGERDGVCAK